MNTKFWIATARRFSFILPSSAARLGLAFLIILTLSTTMGLGMMGCGSTSLNASYSGSVTWTASNLTISQTQMYMTLYQSGSSVTGEFSITGTSGEPISGTLSGTVSGTTLTVSSLTVLSGETYTSSASTTFTGTLTLNGNSLTGTLSGGTFNSTSTSMSVNLTN